MRRVVGEIYMNEKQIKALCKFAIESSNRNFTKLEKELLKHAVDSANNWQELISIAIISLGLGY